MKIVYKARFLRQFKKLTPALQQEAKEKIELLKEDIQHPYLKTHKLKGRLQGWWSFSVNYKDRIVFQYEEYKGEKAIALIAIGDHAVYQ